MPTSFHPRSQSAVHAGRWDENWLYPITGGASWLLTPSNDHVLLLQPVFSPGMAGGEDRRELLFELPVERGRDVSEEMTDNFVSQSL